MSSHLPPPVSPRPRDLRRLTGRRYDVLVIGGGINGAGIARDLAMRGLRVALVEKGDFASGTSSASTKLIHGGLRYLERFDFRLVFEACRERRILQRIAPHLVRPVPFFIPVYRDDPRSLPTIRAGMALYDLLALFRNTRHHSILSAEQGLRREPALREEGLVGVALYWDCRTDDARLCLENVMSAAEAGAAVANYVEVAGLLKKGGRVCGALCRDRERDEELEVEADVVVNAAGPWLDRVCALDGEGRPKLRLTRGTHILVPRINRGSEALYLTTGRDDRLIFVIPWGELSLVGTTDVDFGGDPETVTAAGEDIDYLLAETARHLRMESLFRKDVVASFAGLRPLVGDAGGRPSMASREHRIFESGSGLISVGGGKYTTYRSVAAQVAAMVAERIGRGRGHSITQRVVLPGGATGDFAAFVRRQRRALSAEYDLSPAVVEWLLDRYGSRTAGMLSLLRQDPALAGPVVEGSSLLGVQVAYAADFELARTPEDVLRRRTPLALGEGRGQKELEGVAQIMARYLGGSDPLLQQWKSAYLARYSTP